MNRLCTVLVSALVVTLLISTGRSNAAEEKVDERLVSAIQSIQNWKDETTPGDLGYVEQIVIQAAEDAAQKSAVEQAVIQGLAGAKTRAGRDFFCRQLVMIGTEAAVPELARLLTDPQSSHIARYALARTTVVSLMDRGAE